MDSQGSHQELEGREPGPARQGAAHGPTTTHSAWGAGSPRLIITRDGLHETFLINGDHARIGSAAHCELQLSEIDAMHAEITHDENDEYVLILHGPATTSHAQAQIPSLHVIGEVLRSGAQIIMGPWRVVFERDEFADHGRPYGGRAGGEGARDHDQPARPDYSHERPSVA
jgi:hypothetical protein